MNKRNAPAMAVVLGAFAFGDDALAQGNLKPPGRPAPTMKSLEQIWSKLDSLPVEARTPITSLPLTISTPGSYYLTGNLVFSNPSGSAITVATGNVSIDLNGFTLSSATGVTGVAIDIPSTTVGHVVIRNGFIMGQTEVTNIRTTWDVTPGGFRSGVKVSFDFDFNGPSLAVRDLSISKCREWGFSVGRSAVVQACAASRNGLGGFEGQNGSQFSHCRALENAGRGFLTSVPVIDHCSAFFNKKSGFQCTSGSVSSSVSNGNGEEGFLLNGTCTIAFCNAIVNGGTEISVSSGTAVRTGNNPSP